MTILVVDCETDGFLDQMTRLWTIQLGDAWTDEVTVYADQPGYPPLKEAVERLKAADGHVGHNLYGFDHHAINKIFPGTMEREKTLDTLVMARLGNPEERDHRLMAWGERLGVAKGDYEGDFQTFSEELVTYARQDVVVTRELFRRFWHVLTWGESYAMERDTSFCMFEQERNGFAFNEAAGQELDVKLRAELRQIQEDLQKVFPPIERTVDFYPKRNNKTKGYVAGEKFTKRWMEPFNPGSRQQVAERLVLMGWKPKKFGADGIPSLDEAILSAMKNPVAKPLLRYFELGKKLGMLSDGKNGWLKLVTAEGRIHGRVNPNGARTGRMTHSKPNVAQADKDTAMRSLWVPRPGWKLVGCDGEGVQLRVLAHYLARYDNGALAERIVSGNKKARTDAHSANLRALIDETVLPALYWDDTTPIHDDHTGFHYGRDGAKTCIYAKLFGSSPPGLGRTVTAIFNESGQRPPRIPLTELGLMTNRALSRAMVGLDVMEQKAQAKLKAEGYLVGLDGRRIFSDQPRLALVSLCQGGEAAIMKKALQIFRYERSLDNGWKHGVDYGFCANVHDEVQIEARPDIADELGKCFAECITEAGVRLGFRCPLAGAYEVGANWQETH